MASFFAGVLLGATVVGLWLRRRLACDEFLRLGERNLLLSELEKVRLALAVTGKGRNRAS